MRLEGGSSGVLSNGNDRAAGRAKGTESETDRDHRDQTQGGATDDGGSWPAAKSPDRRRDQICHVPLVQIAPLWLYRTTMFTSLPPAWITLSGCLPSRTATTLGRARTSRSRSASAIPIGTVTRSRSLPLTWTGTSRSFSAAAASSTAGQACVWIDDPASPRDSASRDHSSSV